MRVEGFVPHAAKVAAALSAAVTSRKPIGDTPHSQAEPPMKYRTKPNASCSSGEGVWGRGRFSQRSGLSPRISSHTPSVFPFFVL